MPRRRKLRVDLEHVVLERGHDGFLRGYPEPVLLTAAYAVGEGGAKLLGRNRCALKVTQPFPCTVELAATIHDTKAPTRSKRLVLLGLAVESDRGSDVERLHQGLEQVESWQVRAGDSRLSPPFAIGELALLPPHRPPWAPAVSVTLGGIDPRELCKVDDWIGACLVAIDAESPSRERWRMRFVSANARNDWTAHVDLSVR
jgi:hypothetical protein